MDHRNRRAYASGQFAFYLDDNRPNTAWIQSVEGGVVSASLVDEPVSPDVLRFHHVSVVEIEPLSLQVAIAAATPILQWIQSSWRRKFSRRSGMLVHADFNYRGLIEQHFINALITEITFPTLDGSERNPAYLTVKLHPEHFHIERGKGQELQGIEGHRKAKMWLPSMFRLELDGLDCSQVNRIDAITIKQKIATLRYGSSRFAELEPAGIEFPNLTVSMAAAYADEFVRWHQHFVVRGDREPGQERTGAIHFLHPASGNPPLFSIQLSHVGIHSLSVEKSEANADAIKRCRVELYVDSMDLELGPGSE